MQFQTACISDKGGRLVNQDFSGFSHAKDRGCWVLADGLGGYHAGEFAAKIAVETVLQRYHQHSQQTWIQEAINKTQAILHEQQNESTTMKSMRTTIVILTCRQNDAYWAHVGDSRLYHFREGQSHFQTKDHSVCQALVNAGEITLNQVRNHEDRNRLYRVLGSDGDVKATLQTEGMPIQQGDAFLLCSDGFWEYILEEEMMNARKQTSSAAEWLQKMETILKNRVTNNHDNYTALAVICK